MYTPSCFHPEYPYVLVYLLIWTKYPLVSFLASQSLWISFLWNSGRRVWRKCYSFSKLESDTMMALAVGFNRTRWSLILTVYLSTMKSRKNTMGLAFRAQRRMTWALLVASGEYFRISLKVRFCETLSDPVLLPGMTSEGFSAPRWSSPQHQQRYQSLMSGKDSSNITIYSVDAAKAERVLLIIIGITNFLFNLLSLHKYKK